MSGDGLIIRAMAAGKVEGFKECARRLAAVLDDEPNWHIVFGEVVKLRIRELDRGGMARSSIAEAVGWPPGDIDTVLAERGPTEEASVDVGAVRAKLRFIAKKADNPTNDVWKAGATWAAAQVEAALEGERPPTGVATGETLARFEVVGEADDKALQGWTEGDKQESTHDELTVNPDAWDVGTVITVTRGPTVGASTECPESEDGICYPEGDGHCYWCDRDVLGGRGPVVDPSADMAANAEEMRSPEPSVPDAPEWPSLDELREMKTSAVEKMDDASLGVARRNYHHGEYDVLSMLIERAALDTAKAGS